MNEAHYLPEADLRFPSGPWTGYWAQGLPGHIELGWMDLLLHFTGGRVNGSGCDQVGTFAMSGTYETQTGACCIRKHYHGQHEVVYTGTSEAKGIRGRWEIPALVSGAFHIWPGLAGKGIEEKLETAAAFPFGGDSGGPDWSGHPESVRTSTHRTRGSRAMRRSPSLTERVVSAAAGFQTSPPDRIRFDHEIHGVQDRVAREAPQSRGFGVSS